MACEYQKANVVKYLTEELPAGAVDVTTCCHSNEEGKGATSLHLAALHNAVGVAELLIELKDGCLLKCVDEKVSLIWCGHALT